GWQSVGHRDRPRRQDRLRSRHPVGHGHPNPDRHQHGPRPDQGGTESAGHRDHPDGKTAYVLNNGSGTVTPIRTATSTALAPIRVPAGSFSMAITPDGRTIYVLDLGSSQAQEGMVIPIRTATNTALRSIPIGHAWPST